MTTTFSRSRYVATPSTASSIRTNSTYASSTTTRTWEGILARKPSSSLWVTAGPVGLLGVQTSTTLVRSVTAAAIASRSWRAVGQHRDPHHLRGGGGDRDRVGLEGAPREDHLVARVAERLHQLVDQADRPGRHRQVLDRHAEALAQGGVQRAGAHVRVAVHLVDRAPRRLDHPGQRRVGVLVRGELVRRHPGPDGRRLARDVRRDVEDVGARLGGSHGGQVSRRSDRCDAARAAAAAPRPARSRRRTPPR